ncbi:MAG: deoxyribodipyrimidine photolyase [Proteobacteria bacterium]|nr:MAG: deoxyribodipyrimidine photolyase [Pseudomonadota bacterium]
MRDRRALMWFRRDLRAHDNASLSRALEQNSAVWCVFVFDTEILDHLSSHDRRVEFIHACVVELDTALRALGGGLIVLHGRAREEVPRLAAKLNVAAVYLNHDYEPAAMDRDLAVERALGDLSIAFYSFKDHVIFEKSEVLTRAETPFSVFTPFRRAWLERLSNTQLGSCAVDRHAASFALPPEHRIPSLAELGFEHTNLRELGLPTGTSGGRTWFRDFLSRIDCYAERRDYPALRGPSYLSVHLRFGTLSIRELVREAASHSSEGAKTWLSELIWREFYFMILYHHPHVVDHAFRADLDRIAFPNREDHFLAWCEGRTGYPLVDAAMRQINQTGYMHNRLRMMSASFLVKDLHVDWRWGERYFARQLNDFDLAANNGGWQWAASTGCDPQPYFRIFNPVTQSEKFDPDGRFIRLYLPELKAVPDRYIHEPWGMSEAEQKSCGVVIGRDYPRPIVDHATARQVALELYGKAARSSG